MLTILFLAQYFVIRLIFFELYFRKVLKITTIRTRPVNPQSMANWIKSLLKKEDYSILTLTDDNLINIAYIPWKILPLSEIIKIRGTNIHLFIKEVKKNESGISSQIIIGPINRKNQDIILRIDRMIQDLSDMQA
jgi:hypothetical protein